MNLEEMSVEKLLQLSIDSDLYVRWAAANNYKGCVNFAALEIKRRYYELEAEVKRLTIATEVAESIAYNMAHPINSPCGHSSQYAYGGKHIYCYVCQAANGQRAIEAMEKLVESSNVPLDVFQFTEFASSVISDYQQSKEDTSQCKESEVK